MPRGRNPASRFWKAVVVIQRLTVGHVRVVDVAVSLPRPTSSLSHCRFNAIQRGFCFIIGYQRPYFSEVGHMIFIRIPEFLPRKGNFIKTKDQKKTVRVGTINAYSFGPPVFTIRPLPRVCSALFYLSLRARIATRLVSRARIVMSVKLYESIEACL